MIPIEPISVQYSATNMEIAIPDYRVGASEQEAAVILLTDQGIAVRVERLKIPMASKMSTDDSIIEYVCKQLNIISAKGNIHQNEHPVGNPESNH
jgi:hypothetical protein